MGPFDLIRHPLLAAGITLPQFLRWYFVEQPMGILQKYLDYLRAFFEIFAFVFLLRTLISPWRQITEPYGPERGFNLQQFGQALTLNIVSRTIGCIFRSVTLCIGLVTVTMLSVGFGLFYLAWVGFPLLFWVGLSYVLTMFA